MNTIQVRGARTHNLKNIDLDLPRDKFIVITGLSGSLSASDNSDPVVIIVSLCSISLVSSDLKHTWA